MTPNYFTGGMNFHSRFEFLPVSSFVKSYEMTMKLLELIVKTPDNAKDREEMPFSPRFFFYR